MDFLARIIEFEIWMFVLGLLGLVVYQLASGRMNLKGLLTDKSPQREGRGQRLSPTRVQLLMLTLAGAFGYIALLPGAEPGALPQVPRELLLLFGGSATIYLGGKGTPLMQEFFTTTSTTSNDSESKE